MATQVAVLRVEVDIILLRGTTLAQYRLLLFALVPVTRLKLAGLSVLFAPSE